MTGCAVILSGPSGVGKDTVIDAWHSVNPLVKRVVAATTREPRAGELDGDAYHFKTRAEFDSMVENGEFLEHKLVHGNSYGTPLESVQRMLSAGHIVILKIDVQGALDARLKLPDVVSVFLLPPSWDELEHRIRGRGTDDEATIARRLANAREELSYADRYDHQVVNDQVSNVVATLQSIVAEKLGAAK